jgi:hypothetical protein
MGDNVFEKMTADLMAIEGIKGARYGQSFCNHFGITDYVLFYKVDWASADQHIKAVYLVQP